MALSRLAGRARNRLMYGQSGQSSIRGVAGVSVSHDVP